jgi:hypothetical protein
VLDAAYGVHHIHGFPSVSKCLLLLDASTQPGSYFCPQAVKQKDIEPLENMKFTIPRHYELTAHANNIKLFPTCSHLEFSPPEICFCVQPKNLFLIQLFTQVIMVGHSDNLRLESAQLPFYSSGFVKSSPNLTSSERADLELDIRQDVPFSLTCSTSFVFPCIALDFSLGLQICYF